MAHALESGGESGEPEHNGRQVSPPVLHQATRARDAAGCIIATLDDYAVVRDLVADTIAEGVGTTVPETVRETVAAVGALTCTDGVMVRAVADKLQLDKSNASRRLRVAADGGYVRNLEDKRGKPGRWVIGDPLPDAVDLLPDPAQLATAATGPGRCPQCGFHVPHPRPPRQLFSKHESKHER